MKLAHLLILILFLSSCSGKAQDSKEINTPKDTNQNSWSSKHHKLEVIYAEPWTKIAALDISKKTLFGLIDKADGKSYIIKITEDVSKDNLSDKEYYEATTEQMLAANEKNLLLEENDTVFHGLNFHQLVFAMYTEKWGVLKQHVLIRRENGVMAGFQLSYPVTAETAETANMATEMIALDKNILYAED